jgi:hypothetical protein
MEDIYIQHLILFIVVLYVTNVLSCHYGTPLMS